MRRNLRRNVTWHFPWRVRSSSSLQLSDTEQITAAYTDKSCKFVPIRIARAAAAARQRGHSTLRTLSTQTPFALAATWPMQVARWNTENTTTVGYREFRGCETEGIKSGMSLLCQNLPTSNKTHCVSTI